jgi:uncharacterized damage-inducible protein DinB
MTSSNTSRVCTSARAILSPLFQITSCSGASAKANSTLAELVVHIANARAWNAELITGDGAARYAGHDASNYTTTNSLLELAEAASARALELISAAGLEAAIPSSMGEIAAWRRVFGGLIEHEVHHRSQLCALLSQNGIQPPALYGLFEEQLPR